ncbi:hypothetical protein [Ralstonia pickettii]|jgi:hypothetical protein|uniref:hypothetical protein n=1 Tax=Ralstonia pickettii TaxID=329 RepID=UPI0015FC8204|nr:hypothetical protein [Ralstonia pickettii]MBB0022647.1 hypothetical protein [Ralstonia pickettii]MBB0033204.1 hypothetical protein [Ralstonia pickettii]MBB0096267.1 hypothetical protein [Ralstonia pickettii]MBB0105672.1 hypothetical protein [Ralstonia pickettii]MBB0127316.1 hypothetical protein [Ralstonia pickettii]
MQVATFERRYDGTYRAASPMAQERLSMDAFTSIHGGAPAPAEDAAKCVGVPAGFTLWRTGRGELMAIRAD